MAKMMWIVDPYMNRIVLRRTRDSDRHCFETWAEACGFILNRAEGVVNALHNDMKLAEKRLRQLRSKFQQPTPQSSEPLGKTAARTEGG